MRVLPFFSALGISAQLVHALAQYNQDLAIEFTKIAGAAYCIPEQVEKWDCPQCSANLTSVEMCTATSADHTQAFVGRWKDACVLSFEGTENLASALVDLELYSFEPSPMIRAMCDGCNVHSGYLDVWTHLQPCITTKLQSIGCKEKALHVTGHSLGAGVAAIAMMLLQRSGWNVAESYNFGMPRTGDDAFAKNFTQLFSGKFWRVTHHKDPIVQVPPDTWGPFSSSFAHVLPEIFYDGDVDQGYKMCAQRHDSQCSWKYTNFWDWDLTFADHLTYMDIPMGRRPCQRNMTIIV